MTADDWDRVVAGQPVRRVLPVPGDPAAHARPRLRPHHQHQLDHRRVRQHRPGQLRRRQGRPVRPDHEPGAGDRPQGHHRQLRRPRLHLHRDGRRRAPRRPWTRSSPRSRSAASASPTRSPASSSSSPTPTPASSPARSTPSTAASTCELPLGGQLCPPSEEYLARHRQPSPKRRGRTSDDVARPRWSGSVSSSAGPGPCQREMTAVSSSTASTTTTTTPTATAAPPTPAPRASRNAPVR